MIFVKNIAVFANKQQFEISTKYLWKSINSPDQEYISGNFLILFAYAYTYNPNLYAYTVKFR